MFYCYLSVSQFKYATQSATVNHPTIQLFNHQLFNHSTMLSLTEGDKAPNFKSTDQNGNPLSLADFRGRPVVLYFYPEDDTPTCTVQACNLRDNYSLLKEKGLVVLGISPDDEKKHKKFEQKFDLPFTLVADPRKKIINKYGVWGEKVLYGRHYMGLHRTTFLIDEKGIIRKIFRKPRSAVHTQEILKSWDEINGQKK